MYDTYLNIGRHKSFTLRLLFGGHVTHGYTSKNMAAQDLAKNFSSCGRKTKSLYLDGTPVIAIPPDSLPNKKIPAAGFPGRHLAEPQQATADTGKGPCCSVYEFV